MRNVKHLKCLALKLFVVSWYWPNHVEAGWKVGKGNRMTQRIFRTPDVSARNKWASNSSKGYTKIFEFPAVESSYVAVESPAASDPSLQVNSTVSFPRLEGTIFRRKGKFVMVKDNSINKQCSRLLFEKIHISQSKVPLNLSQNWHFLRFLHSLLF